MASNHGLQRFELHVGAGPYATRVEAHLAVCDYFLSSFESVALIDFVARDGRSMRGWDNDAELMFVYTAVEEISALLFYLDVLPRLLVRDRLVQDGIALAVRRLHVLQPQAPIYSPKWPVDITAFELHGVVRDRDVQGHADDPGKEEAFVLLDQLICSSQPCTWLDSPNEWWSFLTARRLAAGSPSVAAVAAAHGPRRHRDRSVHEAPPDPPPVVPAPHGAAPWEPLGGALCPAADYPLPMSEVWAPGQPIPRQFAAPHAQQQDLIQAAYPEPLSFTWREGELCFPRVN